MKYHDDEGRRRSGGAGPEKPTEKKTAKRTARRGRKGQGSVSWNEKRRRYLGKVPVGRNLDGSTKYLYASDETEAGCIAKLKGAKAPGPTITVGEWCARWKDNLGQRPSTKADYVHTVDRFVVPFLGHLRLVEVTSEQINQVVTRRWIGEIGLGRNTARKNLGHLRKCFDDARKAGLRPDNPAKDADKPKRKKVEIDPFDADELHRIITAPDAGIFAVLGSLGCRVGEALALDVADFNRATGEVRIMKTWSRQHGEREPKSENGKRTIALPPPARPAMDAIVRGRTEGVLFPTQGKTTRRQYSCVRVDWIAFLRRLGLRYRNPHQLRHSVATLAVAAGMPIPDVAAYLGDTKETILKTYVHPTRVDVAGGLGRALLGGNKEAAEAAAPAFVLKFKAKRRAI
jgi:integrase